MAYTWNPIQDTTTLNEFNQLDPAAMAYKMLNRMGYTQNPGFSSTLANDIMPLLMSLLMSEYQVGSGRGGRDIAASAMDPKTGEINTPESVNLLGSMMSALLSPRAAGSGYQPYGSGNLAEMGLGHLAELAKGGFMQGTPGDIALGDPSGQNMWGQVAGLMGNQMGGGLARQFYNPDTFARIRALYDPSSGMNFLAFLQKLGWMPGDYTDSMPSTPIPADPVRPVEEPRTNTPQTVTPQRTRPSVQDDPRFPPRPMAPRPRQVNPFLSALQGRRA